MLLLFATFAALFPCYFFSFPLLDTPAFRTAAVRRVLASAPARRLVPSPTELELLRDYALGFTSRARANRQLGQRLRLPSPAALGA